MKRRNYFIALTAILTVLLFSGEAFAGPHPPRHKAKKHYHKVFRHGRMVRVVHFGPCNRQQSMCNSCSRRGYRSCAHMNGRNGYGNGRNAGCGSSCKGHKGNGKYNNHGHRNHGHGKGRGRR